MSSTKESPASSRHVPEPIRLAPLAFRRTPGAAIAIRRAARIELRLHRRLVEVHRSRDFLRLLRLRHSLHDHAAKRLAGVELDYVLLAHGSGRFHALAVDLHAAAAACVRGLRAVLEEADVLEPVVDAMS